MPTPIFINELHYDNAGADSGEGFEVAGPAGTNLAGWTIVLYNGTGGVTYGTVNLTGIIPDLQNGFGTLSFTFAGIQNGAPDGFALVNASGTVVQFLSYEGVMTATNGPAAGMTSVDIGVSEAGTEAVGNTLRLTGSGTTYEDFTWAGSAAGSFGAVNQGQSFAAVVVNHGELSINDVTISESNAGFDNVTFTVTRANGSTGAVTVDWTLNAGSADAADLLTAIGSGGTLSFADGETSRTITIQVLGDTDFEPDENFTVTLSNATGGATIAERAATPLWWNETLRSSSDIVLSAALEGVLASLSSPRNLT